MHVKGSALQNKRLAVSQMTFRVRKVSGTFEKRALYKFEELSKQTRGSSCLHPVPAMMTLTIELNIKRCWGYDEDDDETL